ncbi:MAG: hypothetical protein VYC39_00310 [Myxococcota bacterium]|nr:hypothetical protein [Myxococcota bacterium]
MSQVRLAELLFASKLITSQQAQEALEESARGQKPFTVCLTGLFGLDTTKLYDDFATCIGVPRYQLLESQFDEDAPKLVSRNWAETYRVLPIRFRAQGQELLVVMSDPTQTSGVESLRTDTTASIRAELVTDEEFNQLLTDYYEPKPAVAPPRLPSSQLVPLEPPPEPNFKIQNLDQMRNELHGVDYETPQGDKLVDRGLTLRRNSSPIPLPTNALIENPLLVQRKNAGVTIEQVRAVFQLCVQRRLFTPEEYFDRLQTKVDPR